VTLDAKAPQAHRLVWVGAGALAFFGLLALLAPWLSPYDPGEMFAPMLAPSTTHPLGTNDIGQDILSQLIYGARFSLLVAFLPTVVSTAVGLLLGLVSGTYDRVGFFVMRVVDVFLAVPRFPLIILMAAFLKPGLQTLVLFFALFGWPRAARLVRSQVMSEKNRAYVEAARVIGADDLRIMAYHLLPGVLPVVSTFCVIEFQHVILAESGLSFLGLGDPTLKSWGVMLSHAFRYPTTFITDVWTWWVVPPGMCITLIVLALTLVGFAMEARVHPQLRRS
jgi:peptide/nickel transport system permease protein